MKTILLVDDEVDIAQTFVWLFEFNGYEVLSASDGKMALEMLARRVPDILISDCMMPVMDGVELTARVRADPATRDLPVILMSAAPGQHSLREAKFDVFLQKPFQFARLLDEVRKLI